MKTEPKPKTMRVLFGTGIVKAAWNVGEMTTDASDNLHIKLSRTAQNYKALVKRLAKISGFSAAIEIRGAPGQHDLPVIVGWPPVDKMRPLLKELDSPEWPLVKFQWYSNTGEPWKLIHLRAKIGRVIKLDRKSSFGWLVMPATICAKESSSLEITVGLHRDQWSPVFYPMTIIAK